jgi:rRNA maturation endonuclease Nob1
MPEVWGWCHPCRRWFYVERGRTKGECPVCGSDAARTVVAEQEPHERPEGAAHA